MIQLSVNYHRKESLLHDISERGTKDGKSGIIKVTRSGRELDGRLCYNVEAANLRKLRMLHVCSSVMIGECPVRTRLVC